MNRAIKHAVIKDQLPTYLQANKKAKGEILSRVMVVTATPRKPVIRVLKREQNRSSLSPPKRRGRKRYYTVETNAVRCIVQNCASVLWLPGELTSWL